jgi:hypothetical protein
MGEGRQWWRHIQSLRNAGKTWDFVYNFLTIISQSQPVQSASTDRNAAGEWVFSKSGCGVPCNSRFFFCSTVVTAELMPAKMFAEAL